MFNLDEEQRIAVYSDERKILVAAAAGSGKTLTLTERIRRLIKDGYDPSKIYAITFTNMAAEEMKDRLGNIEGLFIGTIHSLANRILLLNSIDTSQIINEEQFDLLFKKVKEDNIILPEVEHLLIDEFQDLCDDEFEFTFETLNPKNFFVIGDSRQAIYSFKGGNYRHFLDLVKDKTVQVYQLNNNYRCGFNIIDYAENIIDAVQDVYRTTVKWKNDKYGAVEVEPFSLSKILQEIWAEKDYKNWFILCRTNNELSDMKQYLESKGIPCVTFKKADYSLEELNKNLSSDTVKVLTIHSSKGLQSNKVIVIGARSWNDEERRVNYVAATRAKEYLLWLKEPVKNKRRKDILTF